jgi:pimeloyl-ACP methyl ester carboxylesterase
LLLHGIGSTHSDFAGLQPRLDAEYATLAPDLPGHGRSAPLCVRPTVSAVADAIEADLNELGVDKAHVLGNSLGARLALELASRGRALSVVAIAPSGLNFPPERIYQGAAMGMARLALRALRPLITPAARSVYGRTALLMGLRSTPWRASEAEALALNDGFAASEDFWRLLWWAILTDVPTGLNRIDCPVILAQGTADLIASWQTPRYLALVPGSRFVPLLGAGHAPQGDTPDAVLRLVNLAATASHPGGDTTASCRPISILVPRMAAASPRADGLPLALSGDSLVEVRVRPA